MLETGNPEGGGRESARGWRTCSLFGFALASDFSLVTHLGRASGPPDVTFTCGPEPPVSLRWQGLAPIYASPYRIGDPGELESLAYLYRLDGCEVLRYSRLADFYLWPERIVCHLLAPAHHYMVELRLLGPVFSYWLERRGILALHASGVDVGERAAAFLSGKNGGKTSLAAALMSAGCPLLTDDVLAVEERGDAFLGRPSYPQMRMWPDEAAYFLGDSDDLEVVHPAYAKCRVPVGPGGLGRFCGAERPLARFYLLERQPDGAERVEISPVSSRDAVIELLRLSFAPHLMAAAGRQAQRIDFLARLVDRVPMRRLVYPVGLERLPAVAVAILEDLEAS